MQGLSQVLSAGSRICGVAALGALIALVAATEAWAPATPGGVASLRADANIEVDGQTDFDQFGRSLAGAGDVNGDGRADFVVGAPLATNKGDFSGSAYVVFGTQPAARRIVQASDLGANGFRIDGAAGDRAGREVAGVGDMNGDGKADVAVAAPVADNNGRDKSGSVYVVFGRASTAVVDLPSLGATGFRIDGASAGSLFPVSLAAAGDVNGDGKPDLIASDLKTAYVIFGGNTTSVDTAGVLGSRGFRIQDADLISAVSGLGDVNGDGRSDLGIAGSAPGGTGSYYVVFGKASTSDVDTSALGTAGYHLTLAGANSGVSTNISGGGDINGDGRSDFVIWVPFQDANGRANSGSAFVVFGGSSTEPVDLAALGSRGYRIDGPNANSAFAFGGADAMSRQASVAGDFDGDGKADVLVAMPGSDNGVAGNAGGAAYLVYGKSSTSAVDLASLGTAGFRIEGRTGTPPDGPRTVAAAGDLNKDGRADLLVGASEAAVGGAPKGLAVAIFSGPPPDSEAPVVKPLPTKVKRKKVAKLRFEVSDNSGKAVVEGGVYKGTKKLQGFVSNEVASGHYFVSWRAPAKAQKLSFCVLGKDAAGNESDQACAQIKVT
jgi:hypothetical protein